MTLFEKELREIRTTPIVFVAPPHPTVATGYWLDRYAHMRYLKREPFESDDHLRERVLGV